MLKKRIEHLEGQLGNAASQSALPKRTYSAVIQCAHGKEARRVNFFDPPPAEFVLDGEVLKYGGENAEMAPYIPSPYQNYPPYFSPSIPGFTPVYQSAKCSLACERSKGALNSAA
jgi:hypothetical protein